MHCALAKVKARNGHACDQKRNPGQRGIVAADQELEHLGGRALGAKHWEKQEAHLRENQCCRRGEQTELLCAEPIERQDQHEADPVVCQDGLVRHIEVFQD